MKRHRFGLLFSLGLILALTTAMIGCGDDDDDNDSGGTPTPPVDDDDDDSAAGVCVIEGTTYQPGATHPDNICLICDVALSADSWSLNDGVACDDGLYCDGADTCLAGSCATHVGDPCTDDTVCNEETDACDPTGDDDDDNDDDDNDDNNDTTPDDDDDNDNDDDDDTVPTECVIGGVTYEDGETYPENICLVCDPTANPTGWSFNDGVSCDDGVYCNGTESCSEGLCESTGYPCPNDDGLFCNGYDFCDEVDNQCVNTGFPCGEDTCNEDEDKCESAPATECTIGGVVYQDGATHPNNVCLVCDIDANPNGWSFNNGAACNDAVWCNGDDTCQLGQCSTHAGARCTDDNLWCTGFDFCDEAQDECDHTGDPCYNDGAYCNGAEFCNETADACDNSGDPCPDDGFFCNGDDYCNETDDICGHTGDPCDEEETCIEATDECVLAGNVPDGVQVSGAVTVNGTSLPTYFGDLYTYLIIIWWVEDKGEGYWAIMDTDGSYRMPYVPAGTYNIEVKLDVYGYDPDFSITYRDSYLVEDVTVSDADLTQNLDLPIYEVTGATTDSLGAATNEGKVTVQGGTAAGDAPTELAVTAEYQMPEDVNTYTLYLPAYADYTFKWFPLPGAGLAQEWEPDVAVSADLTHNHQFGAAVSTVNVSLVDDDGNNVWNEWGYYMDMTFTFDNGTMTYVGTVEDEHEVVMDLPDGDYDVTVEVLGEYSGAAHTTQYYNDTLTATVAGSGDLEIEVPLFDITGVVTDPEGAPFWEAYIGASFGTLPADGAKAGPAIKVSTWPDEDTGEYTYYLPAGTYDFTYEPMNSTTLVNEIEEDVVVNADATHDFQFSTTPVTVEGRVTINGQSVQTYFGTILAFVDLYFIDQNGQSYWTTTEFNGDYTLPVTAGNTYTVMVSLDVIIGLTDYLFYFMPEMETGLVPTKDVTRDYDLTMYTISGHVLQPDGETPVEGAYVTMTNDIAMIVGMDGQNDGAVEFAMNIYIAGGTGYYEMNAPAGEMQMSFTDYISGHTEFVNDVTVTADTTLDFVFAWEESK